MCSFMTAIQTFWQSLPPDSIKYVIHAACCALSCVLVHTFVDFNAAGDLKPQRERVLSKLWDLYTVANESNAPELEGLESLTIQIDPFDPAGRTNVDNPPALNPTSYFVPLSHEFIQEHPLDLSRPENCEMMETTARLLRPRDSRSTRQQMPIPSYGKAQILAHHLASVMGASRLNFPPGSWSRLSMATGWRWNM
ncbi:hypothetical protein BP00DRAFT_257810 [Aspergillus indologenus CBS 114.80]|uniref:Uncharacterized protein n=1 Tax=Aspergillus indologenus CBS 114.80 TaxID=1450541 RepID=A0A2V5HVT8_9EURO|nr:hypothetical protein BP00DRAFT_257810 [Aspergillus indologenus CBS 114.80]